jgi:hypothetical protein
VAVAAVLLLLAVGAGLLLGPLNPARAGSGDLAGKGSRLVNVQKKAR